MKPLAVTARSIKRSRSLCKLRQRPHAFAVPQNLFGQYKSRLKFTSVSHPSHLLISIAIHLALQPGPHRHASLWTLRRVPSSRSRLLFFVCSDSAKTSTRSQKALWLQLRETLIAYWLARFSVSLLCSYSWPEGCAACSRWHCCRLHVHAAENRFCGLSETTRRLHRSSGTKNRVDQLHLWPWSCIWRDR